MDKFIQIVTDVNGQVNSAVWGLPGLLLLIGTGILLPLFLKIVRNYVDRKLGGKDIEPMLSYDPQIQAEMAAALKDE